MTKKAAKKLTPAQESARRHQKKAADDHAAALPAGEDIPEGFNKMEGFAETWKPEEKRTLQGIVTKGVRKVELTINRAQQEVRCIEVTAKKDGTRYTVWESKNLRELFSELAEIGEGVEVFIQYDGLGEVERAGNNPPKLFTVAIKA